VPPVLDKKGICKAEASPVLGVGTGALGLVREAEGGELVQPVEEKASRRISLPPPGTYNEVMKNTERGSSRSNVMGR